MTDERCNCTYTGSGSNEKRIPSGNCEYHGSS